MDKITTTQRSINMQRIRSKDTLPELKVRRLIFSLRYRYRLDGRSLPGNPDIVFKSRKKVIFVHGCFWHQHEGAECREKHLPKSNTNYWLPKLENNKLRDISNLQKLKELGWQALVIWECQTNDSRTLTDSIETFLS